MDNQNQSQEVGKIVDIKLKNMLVKPLKLHHNLDVNVKIVIKST